MGFDFFWINSTNKEQGILINELYNICKTKKIKRAKYTKCTNCRKLSKENGLIYKRGGKVIRKLSTFKIAKKAKNKVIH